MSSKRQFDTIDIPYPRRVADHKKQSKLQQVDIQLEERFWSEVTAARCFLAVMSRQQRRYSQKLQTALCSRNITAFCVAP